MTSSSDLLTAETTLIERLRNRAADIAVTTVKMSGYFAEGATNFNKALVEIAQECCAAADLLEQRQAEATRLRTQRDEALDELRKCGEFYEQAQVEISRLREEQGRLKTVCEELMKALDKVTALEPPSEPTR